MFHIVSVLIDLRLSYRSYFETSLLISAHCSSLNIVIKDKKATVRLISDYKKNRVRATVGLRLGDPYYCFLITHLSVLSPKAKIEYRGFCNGYLLC
jgi:hypothetical protein